MLSVFPIILWNKGVSICKWPYINWCHFVSHQRVWNARGHILNCLLWHYLWLYQSACMQWSSKELECMGTKNQREWRYERQHSLSRRYSPLSKRYSSSGHISISQLNINYNNHCDIVSYIHRNVRLSSSSALSMAAKAVWGQQKMETCCPHWNSRMH